MSYDEILKEIKMLRDEVRELSKKIDSVNESTKESKDSMIKMTNHIDFVENVYDRIKKPFNFIMNVVSTKAMPLIKDTELD